MTLCTPRRRISPRTRVKYRAIRDFFKRALGSTSQANIKINSDIAINVTELKQKLVGIERQLDTVNKHCRQMVYLEESVRASHSVISVRSDHNHSNQKIPKPGERDKSAESRGCSQTSNVHVDRDDISNYDYDDNKYKTFANKMSHNRYREDNMDNTAEYNTQFPLSSARLHSNSRMGELNRGSKQFLNYRTREKISSRHKDCTDYFYGETKEVKKYNDEIRRRKSEYKFKKYQDYPDTRKHKKRELDKDFIADIIKRQYRPVKLIGKTLSQISKFSVPVCRDQENQLHNRIDEIDLCSCCYDDCTTRKKSLNDLYGSKRNTRNKPQRKRTEVYNDSNIYDLVPVKEKSSPKSRRKFMEENLLLPYQCYREVPPSPRTQRPRLNLKTQDCAYLGDCIEAPPNRKKKSKPIKIDQLRSSESDLSSEYLNGNRKRKNVPLQKKQIHEDIDETVLNETAATDKTLVEIKDILQNFLLEMKKETSMMQCENEQSPKIPVNTSINSPLMNNGIPCPLPPTPYVHNFPNTCCYPAVLPLCPINNFQNGYIVPNTSYTCADCATNAKDDSCQKTESRTNKTNSRDNPAVVKNNDTDELIKKIYTYVSQIAKDDKVKLHNSKEKVNLERNILSSRSFEDSIARSKHASKCGSQRLKFHSKSCEAIGSRYVSETNTSCSDTVINKSSLMVSSQSNYETEENSEYTVSEKIKESKLTKLLKTFGLLKKKKQYNNKFKDSTSEPFFRKHEHKPYHQEITNYMVHGQEYYQPPLPTNTYPANPETSCNCHHYNPNDGFANSKQVHDIYSPQRLHEQTIHEYTAAPHYLTRQPQPLYHAPIHPHPNFLPSQNNPMGIPFCLKEVEVKSTATQSEKKKSIFSKFATMLQPPQVLAASGDIPPQNGFNREVKEKPGFGFKNMPPQLHNDFTYSTQKKNAGDEFNLRNMMIKKLFYKRNPFSPKNLIIKSLLGKDKMPYGQVPLIPRPPMYY